MLKNKLRCQHTKEKFGEVIYTEASRNELKDSTVER
jgi:hypothetical protein